jgi:hypothetical protein
VKEKKKEAREREKKPFFFASALPIHRPLMSDHVIKPSAKGQAVDYSQFPLLLKVCSLLNTLLDQPRVEDLFGVDVLAFVELR